MRTTIRLRIKEVADAERFIEQLKDWLEAQETNVSLQVGNERWTHYGTNKALKKENTSVQGHL